MLIVANVVAPVPFVAVAVMAVAATVSGQDATGGPPLNGSVV
jgi:hypothetical protein